MNTLPLKPRRVGNDVYNNWSNEQLRHAQSQLIFQLSSDDQAKLANFTNLRAYPTTIGILFVDYSNPGNRATRNPRQEAHKDKNSQDQQVPSASPFCMVNEIPTENGFTVNKVVIAYDHLLVSYDNPAVKSFMIAADAALTDNLKIVENLSMTNDIYYKERELSAIGVEQLVGTARLYFAIHKYAPQSVTSQVDFPKMRLTYYFLATDAKSLHDIVFPIWLRHTFNTKNAGITPVQRVHTMITMKKPIIGDSEMDVYIIPKAGDEVDIHKPTAVKLRSGTLAGGAESAFLVIGRSYGISPIMRPTQHVFSSYISVPRVEESTPLEEASIIAIDEVPLF